MKKRKHQHTYFYARSYKDAAYPNGRVDVYMCSSCRTKSEVHWTGESRFGAHSIPKQPEN